MGSKYIYSCLQFWNMHKINKKDTQNKTQVDSSDGLLLMFSSNHNHSGEYSLIYASKCIYNADPDKHVSPIVAQTDTDSILYTFRPRAILVGPLGGIWPSAITR